MHKRFALLLLAVILLSSAAMASDAAGPSPVLYEGPGFSTAEEAAEFYLHALKSADLRKMLSAFAIETYIDNFNFAAHLQRIRAYSPNMAFAFPNANNLLRDLNIESRKQDIATRIRTQLITFCIPDYDAFSTTSFDTENADSNIAAFVNQLEESLDEMIFERLEFIDFVSPSEVSALYSDEGIRQNMVRQATSLGADELSSVVARFSLDGVVYIHCFNALRYGERWYLESLGGHVAQLLGLSVSTGGIMPVDALGE